MVIKLNNQFELMGNIYSSGYSEAQGMLYGSVFCQALLLQTNSGVYENTIFDCLIDPKKYGANLTVPKWFKENNNYRSCAQWF
jgi:hypothetical protein